MKETSRNSKPTFSCLKANSHFHNIITSLRFTLVKSYKTILVFFFLSNSGSCFCLYIYIVCLMLVYVCIAIPKRILYAIKIITKASNVKLSAGDSKSSFLVRHNLQRFFTVPDVKRYTTLNILWNA